MKNGNCAFLNFVYLFIQNSNIRLKLIGRQCQIFPLNIFYYKIFININICLITKLEDNKLVSITMEDLIQYNVVNSVYKSTS